MATHSEDFVFNGKVTFNNEVTFNSEATFNNDVRIVHQGKTVFYFDASNSALYIGSSEPGADEGDLIIYNGNGDKVFHFSAHASVLWLGSANGADDGGDLKIYNGDGDVTVHLDGANSKVAVASSSQTHSMNPTSLDIDLGVTLT